MKKIELLVVAILISMSVSFAQKIAVLDFKAGVGISQTDVDGLSSTFVTYFSPRGYQLVERSQINQVIEEQGFQQTSLTESQMVRLGQIMNLSKIVVGDVNIVGGSPNLDVRVIDVQSGEVTGRDGATFAWTNYRATMQQLAQKVAGQIGVVYGGNGQSGYAQPSGKSPSGKVETILGYLQVYPEDLGTFNSEPTTVIAAVNRQKLNDYGDWRLPTNEELSLMATAKEKLGMGSISSYMSRENANSGGMKIVRLIRSGDTTSGVDNNMLILQPQLGEKYTINSKSTVVNDMNVQGRTIKASQTVETRQSFMVKNTTETQVMLETQIEAVSMTISQDGSTLRYDSENPYITSPMMAENANEIEKNLHVPYLFSYNRNGIMEYNSAGNMSMNQLENVIVWLPKEELKVGTKWNVECVKNIGDTDQKVVVTYIITDITEKTINASFSAETKGSIKVNYHGSASFDIHTGLIIRSSLTGNASMTITSQGINIPTIQTFSTTINVN
jgi:hypothetical protein